MRRLFFGFLIILTMSAWLSTQAGTCTSISRTNAASLSVLTSSKYNTDLNTVYTAANALDGGCITDGTLEDGALNTTDFAALLSGLQQGCRVLYSSATTVQIDRCMASVNGNFLKTTSATNLSFGCSGCSAEVASTSYYVYIQTGSAGTSLTGLISTTAPNNDGYDNSGNKVVGRFYNNGASDIDQYSIDQWAVSSFRATSTGWVDCGLVAGDFTGFGASPTITQDLCMRSGQNLHIMLKFTANTSTATEARVALKFGGSALTIDPDVASLSAMGSYFTSATDGSNGGAVLGNGGLTYINFGTRGTFGTFTASAIVANQADGAGTDEVLTGTQTMSMYAVVPIAGWGE